MSDCHSVKPERGNGGVWCPSIWREILIGEPLVARPAVYDAAISEAFFQHGVLHHGVVAVGVDAQALVSAEGEGDDAVHDAPHLAAAGNAVDGGVGAVGKPCAVVYLGVGGVVAAAEEEGGDDSALVKAYIAVAAGDVVAQELIGGVAAGPLARVAGGCHETAGMGEYLLEARKVGLDGGADGERGGVGVAVHVCREIR